MSSDENHQRRNEIDCPSFKVFTLGEIVSLRKVYIVSCSKTNRRKTGITKNISKLASLLKFIEIMMVSELLRSCCVPSRRGKRSSYLIDTLLFCNFVTSCLGNQCTINTFDEL